MDVKQHFKQPCRHSFFDLCLTCHLLSLCFTPTETITLIRDGKRDWGCSSSQRSDPQRPRRPSATARTTMSRRQFVCSATCSFSSCAEQNPNGQPKNQPLRTQRQGDDPSSYDRSAPPPCSHSFPDLCLIRHHNSRASRLS